MKRSKKLTITALVAMLFMAIAVTFLSFSHADEENDITVLASNDTAANVSSKTNIDYIIATSNSTDPDVDPYYNIVEIYSDTPSGLQEFCTNKDFENYVVNGYSTLGNIMKTGMVKYTPYKASSITNESTAALVAISNADLIYVNEGKTPFSISNDICEELYNILHTYAVGDYKPLIINSQAASGKNDDSTSKQETMASLATDVFTSGVYYYTFAWDTSKQTVEQFLSHNNGSMYLGINGTKQNTKGKWTTLIKEEKDAEGNVVNDADGNPVVEDTKTMSKFLVLSASGTSTSTMKTELLPDTLVEYSDFTGYHTPSSTDDFALPAGSTSKIYDITGTAVADGIYNGKYAVPNLIQVDEATLTDVEDTDFELGAYDFIIIDETVTGDISEDLYKKLAAAMYGSVSIVYPASMGSSTSVSTGGSVSDFSSYNYLELYYMVATTDNIARYTNIMVTSTKKFNIMIAGNETGAGAIADLINKSTYRGIGGKGSSSNMFTVLEIQPCYPIDTYVAETVNGGSYYTIPANVLNDVDKTLLPTDEDGHVTVEYYDWELTKTKIAEAVGIDESKINLVHMSTEELAASKEPILGTYDLIYVGGNRTALKEDPKTWRNVVGLMNWGVMSAGVTDLELYKYLPIYTMYTHNGDMVKVSVASLGYSGGDVKGGKPMAEVNVGGYQDSFSLLNGNDISYERLEELKKYVDAGMPLIIEDDVSTAYEVMINNATNEAAINDIAMSMWNNASWDQKVALANSIGKQPWEIASDDTATIRSLYNDTLQSYNLEYLQNSIDPDCNMRKFLDACYARKTLDGTTDNGKNTVLWGFNNTSDDVSFADYKAVNTLVATSVRRPKLTVTAMPVTYNYYDADTRLSEGKLNFTFEVEGSTNYETKLLVDDDGDNNFETEMDADVTKNSLKCTVADSYFGPISWMLQVKDKNTDLTAYVKGVSYIKNKNNQKQTVRVLQIMPGEAKVDSDGKLTSTKGEGAQGSNSLYFCPICQNVYERVEYNPIANTGSHFSMWYDGTGAYFESTKDTSSSIYLGKHEHIFGIPRYDSNLTSDGYTGIDDWSTNLADDVSDLYDFDLDILLRSEFEDISQGINDAYNNADAATMTTAINSFVIDASDPDYAEWSLCTTDAEKYSFILKRQYSEDANTAYQNYMSAKSDTETTVAALEAAMDVVIANNTKGYGPDLTTVKRTKRYSDIFNAMGDGTFRYNFTENADTQALANAFYAYRDKKDIEITYHDEYKELNRYAHPENWLEGCYDMVIIGPSDDFAGDDITNPIALADLAEYMEDDGSVLLFHDTLTAARDNGSHELTRTLRGYFGMDRNRGLTANNPTTGVYYLPYTSVDSDRYFMTNLSYKATTDTARYASWVDDIKVAFPNFAPGKYLTNVVYTDSFATSDYGTNKDSSPYRYAQQHWQTATFWYRDAKNSAKNNPNYGTDKASQNNKGIITQYPFTLSDNLNISGTHAQAYALELDSSKMTVWYSLAGGNNKKTSSDATSASSMYAASRNDGMDNYFIYSYGNVNYCGAGHSKITGLGKDNNDERRLYINIIVNSVKPSVNQPSITVYDYKTSDKMDKDGSDYFMEVKDNNVYPEFSFSVYVDTSEAGNKLERVRIYYDLDYLTTNSNVYINDANHILIADMKSGLAAGTIYDVGQDIAELQLKPEYFEPYNQDYTYIVIEATDSKGNIVYQRIKIKLLPHLFEMTQNDINYLDIIDKI